MAKLPAPNAAKIVSTPAETVAIENALWRIHRTSGPRTVAWNQFRFVGPLSSARFDPWTGDLADRNEGVAYFGSTMSGCLAEVFQDSRTVTASVPSIHLSGFVPTSPVNLIDLRGKYPIRIGASHSLNGASKNHCRRWSEAIRSVHKDVHGYCYTGMSGADLYVLFSNALGCFPAQPQFSRSLADSALRERLSGAAKNIGYRLRTF